MRLVGLVKDAHFVQLTGERYDRVQERITAVEAVVALVTRGFNATLRHQARAGREQDQSP